MPIAGLVLVPPSRAVPVDASMLTATLSRPLGGLPPRWVTWEQYYGAVADQDSAVPASLVGDDPTRAFVIFDFTRRIPVGQRILSVADSTLSEQLTGTEYLGGRIVARASVAQEAFGLAPGLTYVFKMSVIVSDGRLMTVFTSFSRP
jgi:hypothetical protein